MGAEQALDNIITNQLSSKTNTKGTRKKKKQRGLLNCTNSVVLCYFKNAVT